MKLHKKREIQASEYTFIVVTPSFNQGQFIEQTILSVMTQKGVQVKYLVQDALSSDTTGAVVTKLKKKFKANPFEFRSEKDAGQTDAINKGIAYFKAMNLDPDKTIFAYINSDDYYLPGAFEKVLQVFTRHKKCQWVVGECQISSKKNSFFHTYLVKPWKFILRKWYRPELLLVLNPIPQPATFMRWSAVEKVGLFNAELAYVMDYEYWLRMQAVFGAPTFVNKVLAVFRIHTTSKGGVAYKKQFAQQFHIARQFTNNALLLLLHQLHNMATIVGYLFAK